jgi:2'-5' RNA ligase
MHRLFVALRPPAVIRALLSTAMSGVPHARWQDDDQLHLTVRYIGEVERPVAEDIALALGHVRGRAAEVKVSGVGVFESRSRIDTLWAGVTPADSLLALHRKVDQALVRIGLEPERRAFVPHLTLARLPRTAGVDGMIDRWRADHAMLSSDGFVFDRLILYESRLGRDGAMYDPVTDWALD